MQFEFDYNSEKYLIDLEHFDRGKDKVEIFALLYDDDQDDTDEYEIKLYRVEGESIAPIKVTEQTREFQEILGEELKRSMPTSFFTNPYFDEVMIFFGTTVLTSKDRYIPISCDQCHRMHLYLTKGKENKTSYIENIQTKLRANPNPLWPFKGKLHVQFSVSDKQSRLNQIDLDNIAKAILDSLKGVVFVDDAQIYMLVATKDFTEGIIGHMIAVKELKSDERPKLQVFLYSGRYRTWGHALKEKVAAGRPVRFVFY